MTRCLNVCIYSGTAVSETRDTHTHEVMERGRCDIQGRRAGDASTCEVCRETRDDPVDPGYADCGRRHIHDRSPNIRRGSAEARVY
jgi:hypothetical protein